MMKKFLVLIAAAGIALVAVFGMNGLRNATDDVVRAGQGAIEAGQSAIDAGRGAIEAGQDAVGQVRDTAAVVGELNTACDLVRAAVDPQTPAQESAVLLQQALGIVDSVVTTYPDVPGVSDLQGAVGTARGALEADPSGQVLKANPGAIESACSRIPPLP